MNDSLKDLERHKKLSSLSNVVLLNNLAAEGSQEHLMTKIHQRVDKEFDGADEREKKIIEEIKAENLRWGSRILKKMNDGEYFAQIQENVREKDVHLFHKFSDKNLGLMELFILGDSLLRAGVKSITLYSPYIPYQRQDKKDDGRVPISSKLIFNLINASFGDRLKRIVTFDMHAKQAQGHFDGPLDELSAVPEFAAAYRDLNLDAIVSPDAGGAKRAHYMASLLGLQYYVLDKRRPAHGEAETSYVLDIDVKGKRLGIIDDIIDSGGSVEGPINYLYENGAEMVVCAATHPVLSKKGGVPAEERLRDTKAKFFFTDSLPEKEEGYYLRNKDWATVLSLDHALAKAFYCNQVGESISEFIRSRERRLKKEKLDFVVKEAYKGALDTDF